MTHLVTYLPLKDQSRDYEEHPPHSDNLSWVALCTGLSPAVNLVRFYVVGVSYGQTLG